MNRCLIRIVKTLVFLLLIAGCTITLYAWKKPDLDNPYEEPDVEFRSAWVCTVHNIDVPKQIGTDEDSINAWKESYLKILARCKELNMNAIVFQVRPANDAFYPSEYNPWSQFLCGYGVNPGWDPLAWMIEVTHDAGLEYHAWLNPYRACAGSEAYPITKGVQGTNGRQVYDYDKNALISAKESYFEGLKNSAGLNKNGEPYKNPIFFEGEKLQHSVVSGTEKKYVLNPAATETIEHLNNTITELVTNYELDGIHFDDYFYPDDASYDHQGTNSEFRGKTFSTEPDVDLADYNSYKAKGGNLDLYDWRRENVNKLIESLSNIIRANNKTSKTNCAFGISPAARWAPSKQACPAGSHRGAEGGMNENCNGYYSYSDLYADTYGWCKKGWIDYILPQDYTYLGSSEAGVPTGEFAKIAKWWSDALQGLSTKLYIGQPIYQLSSWKNSDKCGSLELSYQQKYLQDKKMNVTGYVMFSYKDVNSKDGSYAMSHIRDFLWKKAALTPNYDSYTYKKAQGPATIKSLKDNDDGTFTLGYNAVENGKAYGILEDGKLIARVLGNDTLINFKATEGKAYQLVTYGKDNQMHETKVSINLDEATKNEAPVITNNLEFSTSYKPGTKLTLNFTITDKDLDNLTYNLYLMEGTRRVDIKLDTLLTEKELIIPYDLYGFEAKDLRFVLEVSDGKHVTKWESISFNIENNHVDPTPDPDPVPTPDPDPVPTPDPEPDKKGCSCRKNSYIVSLLSSLALASIVLLKRKEY